MLRKSKPFEYRGETDKFWQYYTRYKDQVYPYCFPKCKKINEVVKDRNGNDKVVIQRIENEMPEFLKELKKKSNKN